MDVMLSPFKAVRRISMLLRLENDVVQQLYQLWQI